MPAPVFSIKIGGEAGQGIKSAGLLFAKFATRAGFNIYNYLEYPSLIRGGHNVMQINISANVVTGPFLKCDFLIALNQDTISKHCNELADRAGILFDSDKKYDCRCHDSFTKAGLPQRENLHRKVCIENASPSVLH